MALANCISSSNKLAGTSGGLVMAVQERLILQVRSETAWHNALQRRQVSTAVQSIIPAGADRRPR
jgi:hypothetical protein